MNTLARRLRVLVVHDYAILAGGAERISIDLRDELRTRGHDARLFASTARSFPLPDHADYSCYGSNGWPRPFLQTANPWAARALGRALKEFNPDVVHVRMFLTQLSPLILPLLEHRRAILHLGNHQTICPVDTKVLPDGTPCTFRAGVACYRQGCVSVAGLARTALQLPMWRRHQNVFDHIVANSHALADTLRADGVAVNSVVWNGTRPAPARPPLNGPPTVAFAGRLMPLKGVDVLLNAMALVAGRIPDSRLRIIGNGPDESRLRSLVRELGLGEHVSMYPHVTRAELDELSGSAWVVAQPSRYREPFANITSETMMRGTALVATNTGGTPELVRDGVNGFLVPPGDPAALADRLIRVLSDRDGAERMGAEGRAFALRELTTDRMVDQFEQLYADVLSSGDSPV
jgi:glycosyltransferase involved in cell wall biosynthesis